MMHRWYRYKYFAHEAPNQYQWQCLFIISKKEIMDGHLQCSQIRRFYFIPICFNYASFKIHLVCRQSLHGWVIRCPVKCGMKLVMPKFQQCNRWSFEMDKKCHCIFHNGCYYLSVLGLNLIHVSRGTRVVCANRGLWIVDYMVSSEVGHGYIVLCLFPV